MSELPQLWAHQKNAIELSKNRSSFALFFEPGCGKTRTALEIITDRYRDHGSLLGTLVLAPPIVCQNWLQEFKKYTKIPDSRILVLTGPGPSRLKALSLARSKYGSSFVAITNYEGLVSVRDLFESLLDWRPDIIIYDESQKIKTHNSKRTNRAHQLSRVAKYRYLLSGTPVLNSPMDIWAQYRAMDNGSCFGDNFWGFRARYFVDKNAHMPRGKHFPNFVIRPGAVEEFREKIGKTSLVVKKSDCLDLPPLLKQTIEVELSKDQQKHYLQMKQDFITFLDSGACTAQLAITKALRLQQIVSGHMPLDNEAKDIFEFKNTPREEALREQLESITENPDSKVLVWASWRHDYKVICDICDTLGIKYVQVHGDISEKNKSIAIEAFRNDPDVRVYIGHPGSGGIGINLVEASYMIYYSRSFNLEHDLQSEARNYRSGSERHNSITRIDIVARNTIDQEIQKALANKIAIGESLLRSIKTSL